MKAQDVIDAVCELNDQYYDQSKEYQEHTPFVVTCTGYQIVVKFFGIRIWDDDNNDMDWDETGNEYRHTIKEWLIIKSQKLQQTGIFKFKPKTT